MSDPCALFTPPQLPRLFELQAVRFPDRVAVEIGDRRVTYAELAADVALVSAMLAPHVGRPGAPIAVQVSEPYRHWLAVAAGFRLGSPTASVSGQLSIELLDHLEATCIATDGAELPVPIGAHRTRVLIDLSKADRVPPPPSPVPIVPAARGRIFLSSGTTGLPKAVIYTFAQLEACLRGEFARCGFDQDTAVFVAMGQGTVMSFNAHFRCWAAGGRAIFPTGTTAAEIATAALKSNMLFTSPIALKSVLKAVGNTANSVERRAFIAGGRLPIGDRNRARTYLCRDIRILYGTTETAGFCIADSALLDRNPGAAGYVRAGATVEVVDEDDKPLPPGREGLIRIRTDCMADSYLRDPITSARFFKNGWFYPGDLGVFADDGLLSVTGRQSDVINIGGMKLAPDALEAELEAVPGVDQATVIALQTQGGDPRLVVATVSQGNWAEIEKAIAQILRGKPHLNFRVPAMPRNDMGKVDRAKLTQQLTPFLHTLGAKTGPRQ